MEGVPTIRYENQEIGHLHMKVNNVVDESILGDCEIQTASPGR